MDYFRFFSRNKVVISTGFLLTFFSSFGQTFFISLYVSSIISELGIKNSLFGATYGLATILSAITLSYAGKFIDTISVRKYTIMTSLVLIISCLIMSFSYNLIFIFAGLWGLRFAGQGLFSHIASTTISKIYTETRGKALSLTSLGYPAGEALLPVVTGSIILLAGWRYSMIINSLFICILIPFIFKFMNNENFKSIVNKKSLSKKNSDFSRSELFRDNNFYIIVLNSSILPFIVTGLFFYQLSLSQEKGWPPELIPACFIAYAGGRAVFSLISGKIIDTYSARAIYPFFLIPFAIGLFAISMFIHPLTAVIYLFLTGVSAGISSPVQTALISEFYGTENLGGIRSLFATIGVLCTALSPFLFGYLIDSGVTLSSIAGISLIGILISMIISFRLDESYTFHLERRTES